VTDGIDRGRVQSLFYSNVRYLEVVEDGIEAGNVIPANFQPTVQALAKVRGNILKAALSPAGWMTSRAPHQRGRIGTGRTGLAGEPD